MRMERRVEQSISSLMKFFWSLNLEEFQIFIELTENMISISSMRNIGGVCRNFRRGNSCIYGRRGSG